MIRKIGDEVLLVGSETTFFHVLSLQGFERNVRAKTCEPSKGITSHTRARSFTTLAKLFLYCSSACSSSSTKYDRGAQNETFYFLTFPRHVFRPNCFRSSHRMAK
jgi:hypothetical protein